MMQTSRAVIQKKEGVAVFLFLTNIIIENITFNSCKTFYGGAIYIYSIAEQSHVSIISYKFVKNEIYDPGKDQPYGGSALYLTVKSGNVDDCTFQSKGTHGIIIRC